MIAIAQSGIRQQPNRPNRPMTSKQIIFSEDARRALQRGIDKVANTIKVTLGPRGRTIILDKPSNPLVSNDGVTIAKEIELKDKFENMGAKLMKEVSVADARQSRRRHHNCGRARTVNDCRRHEKHCRRR